MEKRDESDDEYVAKNARDNIIQLDVDLKKQENVVNYLKHVQIDVSKIKNDPLRTELGKIFEECIRQAKKKYKLLKHKRPISDYSYEESLSFEKDLNQFFQFKKQYGADIPLYGNSDNDD